MEDDEVEVEEVVRQFVEEVVDVDGVYGCERGSGG